MRGRWAYAAVAGRRRDLRTKGKRPLGSPAHRLTVSRLEESLNGMATLSFHAPAATARKIRSAARKQGIPMSRFLRETVERAAVGDPVSGLGRELEKLAIDSMAVVSFERIRARAPTTGVDKMTAGQITAAVKATRRAR